MDRPTILEFIADPQLLGVSLSAAQEALLRAAYALPPASDEHRRLFAECTGREAWPTQPFGEVTVIAGARSGKDSRIAAPVVIYEALFGGHEAQLHRGEVATFPLVAQDARGAKIAFGYIRDYLTGSPLLASQVAEVLAGEIRLANGVSIVCFPCTMRSLRGWSIPVAVADEIGFWRLEGSADADVEILSSIRRGQVGFAQPRLLKISAPYLRSGVLWEDFQRFGQDDPDALVWRAGTQTMNPTIPAARLAREYQMDPGRAHREYDAAFEEVGVDAFLPGAWVDEAIRPGRHELPPTPAVRYAAAVDPSGGGRDAFTLAVVHVEGRGEEARFIQDVMKGWHRIGDGLAAVVREVAECVKRYGLNAVSGDAFGAGWVRERFRDAGILYREAPSDKSAAYRELEPLFAQGRIELLDHSTLALELRRLERRPLPGGKVRVDHPRGPGMHDDHANSLALAVAVAAGAGRKVYGTDYAVL